MRVIGTPEELPQTRYTRCSHCGALLEFGREDLRDVRRRGYSDARTGLVDCARCDRAIRVRA